MKCGHLLLSILLIPTISFCSSNSHRHDKNESLQYVLARSSPYNKKFDLLVCNKTYTRSSITCFVFCSVNAV